jgi:hypothetical protein
VRFPHWFSPPTTQVHSFMICDPCRGTTHAIREIVKGEGFFALWKGLGASLLGAGHAMIQFPVYEALKQWFAERDGVVRLGGSAVTSFCVCVFVVFLCVHVCVCGGGCVPHARGTRARGSSSANGCTLLLCCRMWSVCPHQLSSHRPWFPSCQLPPFRIRTRSSEQGYRCGEWNVAGWWGGGVACWRVTAQCSTGGDVHF